MRRSDEVKAQRRSWTFYETSLFNLSLDQAKINPFALQVRGVDPHPHPISQPENLTRVFPLKGMFRFQETVPIPGQAGQVLDGARRRPSPSV